MKYYLFIDESGDHGLKTVDEKFPVFVLCGVLFAYEDHILFADQMQALKQEFWSSRGVIIHSRDIRRCEKEFQILLDLEIKTRFYERLNGIITGTNYTIISAIIHKSAFIRRYGISANVYSLSLSFILERVVFFLKAQSKPSQLEIIVEKRGRKEDQQLACHYNEICQRGTSYMNPARIQRYQPDLRFMAKRENVDGLQLADLVAYPIANHILDPSRVNLSYQLIAPKLYQVKGRQYGLKQFP